MEWAENEGILDEKLSPEELEKKLAPKREELNKEYHSKKIDRNLLQKT